MFEKTCLFIVVLYLIAACTYISVSGENHEIEINLKDENNSGIFIPAKNDN